MSEEEKQKVKGYEKQNRQTYLTTTNKSHERIPKINNSEKVDLVICSRLLKYIW